MAKTFISVRDVDEETFRKFKSLAIAERLKIGAALTHAMQRQLEGRKKKEYNWKAVEALVKSKPLDFGPGNEHLSEQIDEIVYGLKNDSD